MNRILVLGGAGGFGSTAVEALRRRGASPLVAGRRPPADLVFDAEDPADVRGALRRGDVVLDAAGPFQARTTALVEAAAEIGAHVVDLSDSLPYAERVVALADEFARADVAVLPSASTVSALSAAIVATSGIPAPEGVALCLVPGARRTARPGTAKALLSTLGREIRVRRGGALVPAIGFRDVRRFALPPPWGEVKGRLMESADSLLLPMGWPGLATVEMYVHLAVPGMGPLLGGASRSRLLRAALVAGRSVGTSFARRTGASSGCVAWEIAGGGRRASIALVGSGPTHASAVMPAVLATLALANGTFRPRGLVPPHRHGDPDALFAALRELGIERVQVG